MGIKYFLLLLGVFAIQAPKPGTFHDYLFNPGVSYLPFDTAFVPLGGNTWESGGQDSRENVRNRGIVKWDDASARYTAYVRVADTGNIKVWAYADVPAGKSRIQLTVAGRPRQINMQGRLEKCYFMGRWDVKDTGYIAFYFRGISKTGNVFANLDSLKLAGTAINENASFVKNNKDNYYYWGRRGPSVHLNYLVPESMNVSWFYTEITVPKGNDVTGSYFEADGFRQGYFGMQVNSPTTRHILFSVWSPYQTQDPHDVPDSLRIRLVKKGEDVHAGKFGGEGSGGQSYLNYMWKAGTTYGFLVHCQPDRGDHTTFTAYFYAPEEGKWQLIASFSRPKTHSYLKGLYSFVENFSPDQGNIERMAFYGNQWICTDKGQWIELNKARFTTDATGNKGYRMDYAGGVKEDRFYLRNCGFFSDYTPSNTTLTRPLRREKPAIDFKGLP